MGDNPKGMTEIRPGVWRIRVYAGRHANGSPIQMAATFRSPEAIERGDKARPGSGQRLALEVRARMLAEISKGNATTATETVGDLLDRWLDHCESLGRSPTTVREYRRIAEKVVGPELGHVRLGKLTAGDLDNLYAKLTAKGNKATTTRRVHALIGAALHQAERWDLVERNVARRASPPPVHSAQIVAPSPEDVQAILAAAEQIEPTLAALLLIAALTGARRGELCGLRWADIDRQAGTITIERSVYETPGGGWGIKSTKTHQSRRIGLDKLGLEVLRLHRLAVEALAGKLDLEVRTDAFMFSRSPVGAEPIRPDVLTKFTTRVGKLVGVDTHLHALRHFSATQAIAAGFDPVTVGGRLGHADPSITLRVYSHALERRDRDLAAALGRTLALPAPGPLITAP